MDDNINKILFVFVLVFAVAVMNLEKPLPLKLTVDAMGSLLIEFPIDPNSDYSELNIFEFSDLTGLTGSATTS